MTPNNLKAWRKRMGWTQTDLAEALDLHPMTVSKWERGVQEPEHPAMLRLALERLEDPHPSYGNDWGEPEGVEDDGP